MDKITKDVKLEQLLQVKKLIPDWKKEFQNSSQEKKKMMLSGIIDLIIVNDNDIEIKLKMSLEDFIVDSKYLDDKEDVASLKKSKKNFENLNNTRT